jgi:hypothetical protein
VDSGSTKLTEVVDKSVAVFCSCCGPVGLWSVRSRASGRIEGSRVAANSSEVVWDGGGRDGSM